MIDIKIGVLCIDQNKPTQRTGCIIILDFVDEWRRKAHREIAVPLGSSTKARAEIVAATTGLMSIAKKFRAHQTKLHLSGAMQYLTKDANGWTQKSSKNKKEVDELRKWFSMFPSILVVPFSKDEAATHNEKARRCADKQEGADTLTTVI